MELEMTFLDSPIQYSPSIDPKIVCQISSIFKFSERHISIYNSMLKKIPGVYVHEYTEDYDIHIEINEYVTEIIMCGKEFIKSDFSFHN